MYCKHACLSSNETPCAGNVRYNAGIPDHKRHTSGIIGKHYEHDMKCSYSYQWAWNQTNGSFGSTCTLSNKYRAADSRVYL